jgi:DNA-binding beta-propeller fold protein YncE
VAVAVLDDCDTNFRGEGPHGDGIRLFSREGKELFALQGLNNCQTVGANHAVAIDAKRGRIYFRQLVAHRVTALDFFGDTRFEADLRAGGLAVDPATGNVWCLTGDSRGSWHGDTVVLNERGELVATYPIDGFDIAHDAKTDTFWIVGSSIAKVDRRGEVIFRKSPGGWARVSVAVNPRDGSAWIAERQHPDVPDSANLLLRLDSKGNELQRIDLAPNSPFCAACDPETGTAWVVDLRKAILRVPIGTHQSERLEIPATAIAIGPETGQIWATTENEILHLDKQGKPLARYPFGKRSGQSWISVR